MYKYKVLIMSNFIGNNIKHNLISQIVYSQHAPTTREVSIEAH